MKRFEYLQVGLFEGRVLLLGQDIETLLNPEDHSLVEIFNDLGQDGWEMVTLSLYQEPDRKGLGGHVWFKRLLKE